jgi:hypothetical protein
MFVAGRREVLFHVILSEAKDLCIDLKKMRRCFASLSMTDKCFSGTCQVTVAG